MIFDSLGHPTVSGKWLDKEILSTFEDYNKQLVENKYLGGLAVGIWGKNNYSHAKFATLAKEYSLIHPVAGISVHDTGVTELDLIKKSGFVAIKIHPRYSHIHLSRHRSKLVEVIAYCGTISLPVLICTYNHCEIGNYPDADPLYSLVNILKKTLNTKVVLVHGGDIRLLEFAELVRFNTNLLLDLSLTLMKYQKSSIDLDIQFLFNFFDKKICIGSDHPEYNLREVKARFLKLASELPDNKTKRIGYENIVNFLDLKI